MGRFSCEFWLFSLENRLKSADCSANFDFFPAKSADFSANLPPKIPRNFAFFSAKYQKPCRINKSSFIATRTLLLFSHIYFSGLLIFRGKKSKISRDFQGQIRGKIGRFRGKKVKIRGKIGRFRGSKVKIHRIIVRFCGILAVKSQISKDFQGQILRKIGRFHGKISGENFAKKQSVKNSRFRWIFFGKFR